MKAHSSCLFTLKRDRVQQIMSFLDILESDVKQSELQLHREGTI